ncbi:MAG TPA: hypothetical protein VLZ10_14195 [Thermodesulfobacteriota bacterium]|nr:hypothetical protein [Thermodesulfobacteriota bacterium]
MITDCQNPRPINYLTKRAITILKTDGAAHLLKRMMDRLFLKPLLSHNFVYVNKFCADYPVSMCEGELEFKEITAADDDEIDELTAVDEWHTSKSFTLKRLEEGEHIYVAKHQDRIVTSVSIVARDKFEDVFFKREFEMAPDELYYWRGFCVPEFRGRGAVPAVARYSLTDMALKYGRKNAFAIVLNTNKSSQRTVSKAGYVKVGRVGFFEMFGIRFHYLWGREAFKETRRRFLIQNIG